MCLAGPDTSRAKSRPSSNVGIFTPAPFDEAKKNGMDRNQQEE